MLQLHLIEELTSISRQLDNPTLTQLAKALGLEEYYPPEPEGITIYDKITNKPVYCRLCGECNNWIEEGTVMVCDHTREYDLPLRVVDSIRVDKVYIKNE